MRSISLITSGLNSTMSSSRFKNSGRKCCRVVLAGVDGVGDGAALRFDLGETAPDESFGRRDGALRVENGLAASQLSYQAFAIAANSDHRWCGSVTLGVGDDGRLATFHHRDH